MLPELDQQPARTIGRYALFAEIASGGMASIHIGRLLGPVGFSRTVAIKRLHPQFARDPEFVTMFLDEARLAARIRHPNVAPTLDVVATQGELFLVMEYIQGESLAQLVRATQELGERIPQEIVRAIMSGVLHGLHAAHEAKNERGEALGIVHRDISPQNILVGTDGVARLLDFGIAKAVGRSHVTRDRHVKGKLSYMAPEQIENVGVDRRVDVYAAAVVLWELLTGRRLFDAESDSSKVMRVLTSVVARPSSIVPGIPASLDRLVLRGMNRNPKFRYETAREMALALEASGRMATPSVVGAWVEAIAHKVLADRAAHIAAVEQLDDLAPDSASTHLPLIKPDVAANDQPTVIGPNGESEFVEDSSIDLVPSRGEAHEVAAESTRSPSGLVGNRGRRVLAYSALFAVPACLLLVWNNLSPRSGNDLLHRTSASHVSALVHETRSITQKVANLTHAATGGVSVSSPLTRNEAPSDADGNNPAPINPPTMGSVADMSAERDQREMVAKLPSSASPGPTARSKSKTNDCNPPFTLDAAGIRHYKRKCL